VHLHSLFSFYFHYFFVEKYFEYNYFFSVLLVLHAYGCETPRPFTHPHTHCPEKRKKKNRVEGRVEHGTSKSNIYLLLLLELHVRWLLAAVLIRRFVAAVHDCQIGPRQGE